MVQDLRYVEYVTALGSTLLAVEDVDFERRDAGDVLLCFAHELRLNYDREFARDLVYVNHLFEDDSVYSALRPGPENKRVFPLAMQQMFIAGIIRHELQHVYLRAGLEDEQAFGLERMEQVFAYSKKALFDDRSDELSKMNMVVLEFVLKHERKRDRLVSEELLCDAPLLIDGFCTFLAKFEEHGVTPEDGIIALAARMQLALACSIQLLESTRIRTLVNDAGLSKDAALAQLRMFTCRKAFLFVGLIQLIEEYEAAAGIESVASKRVMREFRSLNERTWLLFKEIDAITNPLIFGGLHSMATDVTTARGLSTEECVALVHENWKLSAAR